MTEGETSKIQSIQGLRAVAVLSVVVYHASVFWPDIKTIFPGGFLGVDIFFVISGYVITRSLLRGLNTGNFSLASFYLKRVRRLLPALLALSLLVVPSSRLFPEWSETLWIFGLLGALGLNNFAFWLTDEYDSASLQSNPFLHTWSLGVEEQFYIVLSLLFLFTALKSLRSLTATVFTLSLLSFSFTIFWWSNDASASFYLILGRFWELGAGVLLAITMQRGFGFKSNGQNLFKIASYVGFSMVLFFLFSFELTSRHPGPGTFGLVFGTCLLIMGAQSDSLVNRSLGNPIFKSIGNASYSIYLWHWPSAIVIGTFFETSIFWKLIAYAVFSMLLGYLSRIYIESPWLRARTGTRSVSKGRVVKVVSISVVLLASISISTAQHGTTSEDLADSSVDQLEPEAPEAQQIAPLEQRLSAEDFLATHVRPDLKNYCADWSEGDHSDSYCEIGDADGSKTILLVGDSHSLSMLDFLHNYLLSRGQSGYFGYSSGCPSLPGLYPDRNKTSQILNCFDAAENLSKMIENKTVNNIWMVNRWDYYIGMGGNLLSDRPEGPFTIEQSRILAKDSLASLIASATESGIQLTIFDQPPQQSVSPREIDAESLDASLDFQASPSAWLAASSISTDAHLEREFLEDAFFKQVFIQTEVERESILVENDDYFCSSTICLIGDDDGIYYFDDDHLSIHGVESFFESSLGLSILDKTFN